MAARTKGRLPSIAASMSIVTPLLFLSYFLLLIPNGALVRGHGYLATPRSRNVYAQENTNWAGGWTDSDPMPENCMQCLSGVSSGGCGIAGQNNYDVPRNVFGAVLKPKIQATYAQGQEVVLDVVLTAHHKGHFEFSGCPILKGEVSSQACFDRYRLTFVEDLIHGANFDRRYPDRAYVAPFTDTESSRLYSFKMRLPSNLSGDLVLIQWHYVTANSCIHDGYLNYKWPKDWNYELKGMDQCSVHGGAEQFWNCAEVRIKGGRNINHSSNNNTVNNETKPDKKNNTGKKKNPDKKKQPGKTKNRRSKRAKVKKKDRPGKAKYHGHMD